MAITPNDESSEDESLTGNNTNKRVKRVNDKHSQVKHKVDELQQNMTRSMLQAEIFEKDYFSSNHPKTKEVEQFVRIINERKMKMKKEFEIARHRQAEIKRKKEELKKQQQEEQKRQEQWRKHEQVEVKQRLRQMLRQANKKKQKQYRQFMKSQDRPNDKQYEKYVKKVVLPEHFRLVDKIAAKKGIDVQELQEHERMYEDHLERQKERRVDMARMSQPPEPEQHYKGKYRYMVLKEMIEQRQKDAEDPKEAQRIKKYKEQQYANQIKQHYTPKADPKKQFESYLNVLNSQSYRKREFLLKDLNHGGKGPELRYRSIEMEPVYKNPRIEGLKNLDELHMNIKNMKQKGLVKKNYATLTPQPLVKKNYLEDLKKEHEPLSMSERVNRQVQKSPIYEVKGYENLKNSAQKIDEKIKRKQKFIRNLKNDPAKDMELKDQVDDDYIASITAKLYLLGVKQLQNQS